MAVKLTKNQANAAFAPTGNLLVSAAAGSGKTAVLTQRVIDKLTCKDAVSTQQLVVVTFSNASAAEMKHRIQKMMRKLTQSEPDNMFLQSQLTMLSKARISTIHSLCGELIKENFQALDVSVNYRMAEENEIKIIKTQVLEQVVDEFYDSGDADFLTLAEYYTKKDDSPLFGIISDVYEFVRPFPFYTDMLDEFLAMYQGDEPLNENIWVKALFPDIKARIRTAHTMFMQIYDDIYKFPAIAAKYSEAYENDLNTAKLLLKQADLEDWERCCDIFSTYKKLSLGRVTFDDKDFTAYLQSVRNDACDILEGLRSDYFVVNSEKYKEEIAIITPILRKLFEVVKAYDAKFAEQKKQSNILDFGDLEHFALELLVCRDGDYYVKTPIGIKLSEELEEIMIDECQDINTVQNLIFWGLSKSSDRVKNDFSHIQKDSQNLFMVGDVKQSIYRFRNAMPKLFVNKSNISAHFDEESYSRGDMAKIILQNNFRSSEYVTNFVNLVFSQIMSKNFGEIEYTQDEYLIPSLPMPTNDDALAKVHILDIPKGEEKKELGDLNTMDFEAAHIANIIVDMLKNGHKISENGGLRKCKPSDFCILLRSKKNKFDVYMAALKEKGLDCFCDANNGYFDSFEISVMLNLLRIIDNPLQDIALFSVMLSPLYMFTADDIASIRVMDKDVPLYVALTLKAQLEDDTKCKEFIASIEHLRQQSLIISTHKLIEMIYDSTGFINIVQSMTAGEERRANLRLLLTYAQSYENIGYRGVSGFIKYVDIAIERGEDFSAANVLPQNSNAVKIMTIHSSKGLEFPICILANATKKPNFEDMKKPYILNSEFGIGIKVTKHEEYKSYTSLPYEAIKYISKKETLSEELRTLYVAMTRPQSELIVVGGMSDIDTKIEKIKSMISYNKDDITMSLMKYNSYLEWILCAMAKKKSLDDSFDFDKYIKIFPISQNGKVESEGVEQASVNEQLLSEIAQKLNFTYKHESLSQIPAKITVTQIAKSSQDLFATKLDNLHLDEPDEITGAMRGTVLHSFMQYADYENASANLDLEIRRLVDKKFLLQSESELLNKAKIKAFFKSDIYTRIKNSVSTFREYQFIYEMNAGEIYPHLEDEYQSQKIVVQGIADTIFIEDSGAVILDYKTDIVKTEDELIERYQTQLLIYKEALDSHFDNGVNECYIYSLHLKKAIKIDF